MRLTSSEYQMIVCMMGPSGCGKTSIIEQIMREAEPGVCHHVHVGRMLRAKYPVEKFKGRAAVEETEPEAIALMEEGILEGLRNGATYIFVDGQPRTPQQVDRLMSIIALSEDDMGENDARFVGAMLCSVLLFATTGVRFDRLQDRDHGDPQRLALSRERLHNDLIDGYGVLCRMMLEDWRPEAFDTSAGTVEQQADLVAAYLHKKHEMGASVMSAMCLKSWRARNMSA